ncbi:MAG: FAD-dependent oxidoreductase, partial [Gammaproteobacteria bacterium]
MERIDAIIVGSGQGGVPLAIDLANQGKQVLVFERDRLGGSCVNWGCTPTKAFLAAAHAAGRARQSERLGIHCEVTVDFAQVMEWVRSLRDQFRKGVRDKLDRAGVRVVRAEASLTTSGQVQGAEQLFTAPVVVINTGSRAAIPPINGLQDTPFLTDHNFWDLEALPR